MAKPETVRPMTDGQRGDLIATMAGAIPSDLTFDEAQGIIGAKGPFVAEVRAAFERRRKGCPASKLPHHPDGEVFELTLDGDAPDNQPLEMVRRDGYDHPELWRHSGPTVKGAQTRKFKWVSIGYCETFDEVKRKLAKHGKIPKGQWREAVKEKFQPDGVHPRGSADASWVDPEGLANFPCVITDGSSDFRWTGRGFGGGWRWLVGVVE